MPVTHQASCAPLGPLPLPPGRGERRLWRGRGESPGSPGRGVQGPRSPSPEMGTTGGAVDTARWDEQDKSGPCVWSLGPRWPSGPRKSREGVSLLEAREREGPEGSAGRHGPWATKESSSSHQAPKWALGRVGLSWAGDHWSPRPAACWLHVFLSEPQSLHLRAGNGGP